ncbi:OmpA family protein [Flavobacterium terrigena]|uniref:Outer membrane protein OmpA n=1 Tax=Flavobacterium terrigena TaxID=402734 RepID=A0A1H6UIW6_9FLAO|nr:OmpA family protein [Flavobacterium terrigena]SEI92251.1 Outer membrane protein OmpA [Flavobacterium terrigena]
MKSIFCILFSLIATSFYAQKTFIVYFDTNSHQLSSSELNRLDKEFKNKNVDILSVSGFCDSRATNDHNDSLAENRAKFVGNLLKKIVNASGYKLINKGENFTQNKDLSKNRKVEIVYEYKFESNASSETLKQDELTTNINASKIGDKLVLKNMSFYDRTDMLYPESKPIREELLHALKDNPKLKIEIQGHICCSHQVDKEEIALKRCIAIYNYLVSNGIEKTRLSYKSYDSTKPIFSIPEKNEEERKANRRVEILIVNK